MFLPNSTEKVWWICPKGHSYQSSFAHRNEGKGCPYCSGQKILVGFNDLATTNPKLAAEWDYEKNVDKLPENYTGGGNVKVWWKCAVTTRGKHQYILEIKALTAQAALRKQGL